MIFPLRAKKVITNMIIIKTKELLVMLTILSNFNCGYINKILDFNAIKNNQKGFFDYSLDDNGYSKYIVMKLKKTRDELKNDIGSWNRKDTLFIIDQFFDNNFTETYCFTRDTSYKGYAISSNNNKLMQYAPINERCKTKILDSFVNSKHRANNFGLNSVYFLSIIPPKGEVVTYLLKEDYICFYRNQTLETSDLKWWNWILYRRL